MSSVIFGFFQGFLIGVANIIPGLSGGTMAVMLGIYDRLIESVSQFLLRPEKRVGYVLFLGRIAFGAAIALYSCSFLFDYLFQHYEIGTYLFFMGLVAGSLPVVWQQSLDMRVSLSRVSVLILFSGALLLMDMMMGQVVVAAEGAQVGVSWVLLLVSGVLAAAALVIPGVSGSFVLLMMGTYHVVLTAVKELHVETLFWVALGAVVGMLGCSQVIFFCLRRFKSMTYYAIVGLLLASVVVIYPGMPGSFLSGLLFFVGVFVALGFSKVSESST